MSVVHRYLFPAVWLSWALYWWALSRNVKASVRTEPIHSRLLHIVPLMIAATLLFPSHVPLSVLSERFMPPAAWPFWVGAAATLAGILLTLWARVHLGRNWSGVVTVKEDHELIQSGPYGIVRHPIYSGLLLAFAGSALARGEWRGVVAVAIVGWAFWRKMRTEERWMRERFGSAYQSYSERVPALVPSIF